MWIFITVECLLKAVCGTIRKECKIPMSGSVLCYKENFICVFSNHILLYYCVLNVVLCDNCLQYQDLKRRNPKWRKNTLNFMSVILRLDYWLTFCVAQSTFFNNLCIKLVILFCNEDWSSSLYKPRAVSAVSSPSTDCVNLIFLIFCMLNMILL